METTIFQEVIQIVIGIITALGLSFYIYSSIKKKKTKVKAKVKQETNGGLGQVFTAGGDVNYYSGLPGSSMPAQTAQSKQSNEPDEPKHNYNINILFIDDGPSAEADMPRIKALSSYGYTNVHLINDGTVMSPEVQAADIIFVDITGVGKAAGCAEGTELAVLIKKKYASAKKVAIYSSTETHNITVKGITMLDANFGKNDDTQIYIDFIEGNDTQN